MTPHPTDELSRMLRGAADDLVERAHPPGPDAPALWSQGRRVTWAGRAAAAAIVAVVILIVATGGLLVSGFPSTAPATGGATTYPEVVSDMFVRDVVVGGGPTFGLVATVPTDSEPDDTLVIERQGALAALKTVNPSSGEFLRLSGDGTLLSLSPDGQRAWTSQGIVDLADGLVTRPGPSTPASTAVRGVWSPDSEHVLLDTADGPAVMNGYADVVLSPVPGDQGVRAAGWLDAATVVGVRPSVDGGLDIVARGLTDPTWQAMGAVAADAVNGPSAPSRAFAAPDGSRLLLLWPAGSGPAGSVLVDARTGARVPLAGDASATTVAWDSCGPVWLAGQPLLAHAGLRRPVTGESVLSFSGHREHGCIALAGNELSGAPAPGAAGAWQERAWQVWTAALPLGGVLVLAGGVWMVVALRRSRRHGEDFLPMMLGRLF